MNSHQAALASQEAAKVQTNRALMGNWKNAFEELDHMALAGKLNPEAYNAITSPIVAQITQTVPAAEAENLGKAIFPSMKDWGKARQEKIRFGYDHFKTMEAGTPTLTNFGLKTPFPDAPILKGKENKGEGTVAKNEKPKSSPAPKTETKQMHGATYKKVHGGWQKVK